MRVCIIGINGLLGQNLLRSAPPEAEVFGTGLEEFPVVSHFPLSSYRTLDIGNFEQLTRVLREISADWVINAAAMTAVDLCEAEQQNCFRLNAEAPEVMARVSRRLLHLSTDYVFNGRSGPYAESDATDPLSVYGRSKLESESKVLSASPDHLVVRTMTLYGTGTSLRPNFVDWVRSRLEKGDPTPVVTDQIGNPTLASDLAENLWALIRTNSSGLFHCSGGERCSRYAWAERIAQYFHLPAELLSPVLTTELRQPASRPLRSGFILDKIAKIPQVRIEGIDSQLRRYVEEVHRADN